VVLCKLGEHPYPAARGRRGRSRGDQHGPRQEGREELLRLQLRPLRNGRQMPLGINS